MNKRICWHDAIIYKTVFWKSNKMKDVLCASITCNYLIDCCFLSHSLPDSTQQLKCCHISVNHKLTKAGNLIFFYWVIASFTEKKVTRNLSLSTCTISSFFPISFLFFFSIFKYSFMLFYYACQTWSEMMKQSEQLGGSREMKKSGVKDIKKILWMISVGLVIPQCKV